MDLRKVSRFERKKMKRISQEELEKAYIELCSFLNEKYKLEMCQTSFEHLVFQAIQNITRMRVFRSIWIGKRNFDIFIPSVRGKISGEFSDSTSNLNGLVIEVDGEIHETYSKMKRDESKFDLLRELKIGVVVIQNNDLKHPAVLDLLDSIPMLAKQDTRARERLFRNIYLKTIVSNKKIILENDIAMCKRLIQRLEARYL